MNQRCWTNFTKQNKNLSLSKRQSVSAYSTVLGLSHFFRGQRAISQFNLMPTQHFLAPIIVQNLIKTLVGAAAHFFAIHKRVWWSGGFEIFNNITCRKQPNPRFGCARVCVCEWLLILFYSLSVTFVHSSK